MGKASWEDVLEELAELIVALDGNDLGTLMPLADRFGCLTSAPQPWLVACGQAGVTLVDRLLLDGRFDAELLARRLQVIIANCRRLLEQGGDPAALDWPVEFATVVGSDPLKTAGWTLSPLVDPLLLGEFLSRATTALPEIESGLLALEQGGPVDEIRGLIHTLKGEAGALGLAEVERISHLLEDVLCLGTNQAQGVADVLLAGLDWIRGALDSLAGKGRKPGGTEKIIARLQQVTKARGDHLPTDALPTNGPPAGGPGLEYSRDPQEMAEFLAEVGEHLESADAELLKQESGEEDPGSVDALFRAFHTIKGLSSFFSCHLVNRIAHETESLLDQARTAQKPLTHAAIEVVFQAVDALRGQLEDLKAYVTSGAQPIHRFDLTDFVARVRAAMAAAEQGLDEAAPSAAAAVSLQDLTAALVAGGRVDATALTRRLSQVPTEVRRDITRAVKALVSDGAVSAGDMARALRQAKAEAAVRSAVKEAIKVDAERLDRLVDLIGELVIAQAMVAQSTELRAVRSLTLTGRLAQVEKLVREVQELGTSLRMIPIKQTFQRMQRMVRDLAKKLEKNVEFSMAGEDTELDKTVVDRLGDPLVHMVRNSLDHGLEATEAERLAAGKPAAGRVELRAFHKGGNIHIEISDDGRGLDRERILAKARAQGLIGPDETPAERELFALIFRPGFSTAAQVTEVSGRGVGMDVVKRTIDSLRGTIDITSTPGRGTTFSLRLPLTLAVIDGMVVRVGQERYIVPTLSIVSSLRPGPAQVPTALGRGELLLWQGRTLTLYRLAHLFHVAEAVTDPTHGLVIIVEDEGRQIAFLADEILGQQQVVIKPLGGGLKNLPGISGGAILPDGQVGLIVDASGLVRLAEGGQDTIHPVPEGAAS